MLRCKRLLPRSSRLFHTCPRPLNQGIFNPSKISRVEDEVDVCIVGGGPAGLSAAIRLKQIEREKGKEIRVVVLEKGSEIGSHIVSGAVIEPRALDELLPSWPSLPNHPLTQPATSSHMFYLTPNYAIPIPHPPQMGNEGNYIVSLSQFTSWLGNIAQDEFGVEVYPGFAGAGLLLSDYEDSPDPFDEEGRKVKSVRGIITNEVGLSKSYLKKSTFEPGMIFRSKVTLIAEGAHGSLSKQLYSIYNLRRHAQPQTYALGLKEVWRIGDDDKEKYKPGQVVHTMGWPLDKDTYGGGWVYHMDDGLVSLGLVIGLDYKNPWLSPYREFQRMKHHPYFRSLLSSPTSTRLSYAARVLNEGGLQSVPTKLHFPGGAIIGCSAGFVNVGKIKGTHNAMKSGMLAAEAAWEAVHPSSTSSSLSAASTAAADPSAASPTPTAAPDLSSYTTSLFNSWIHSDLYEIRNLRPSFNTQFGIWGGILYSGIDSLFLKGRVPWTFKHQKESDVKNPHSPSTSHDASATQPSSSHIPITYPPYEPPLSTDLLTSVSLTGTNHGEDQPIHLRVVSTHHYLDEVMRGNGAAVGVGIEAVRNVTEDEVGDEDGGKGKIELAVREEIKRRQDHVRVNVGEYAGLLGRACPAGVYEYVEDVEGEGEGEGWGGRKLVINSQNCIHCKLCDIKVPTQDITWTVPEGGGGPKYS